MKYKYITIQAIPQNLELILDDNSETNKAIEKETKLALNAPALKNCLDTIHALAVNKQAGVNTVEYNRNLLNLIEIQAKNTLGILK